ncbi:MAG: type III pantothenate kinase [Candidatus Riflebacteria bacterium]|nr:type III pantothenate kinase [Candidatus Riflebacteria bacterium]
MILCLDVGNTQIYGGLYENARLKLQFRKHTGPEASSDEHGIFLRTVLKENGIEPDLIKKIGFSSVVPEMIHSLKNACQRYFTINPFILEPGVKTGLKIKYKNPTELGPDRIADAIGALNMFPARDVLIMGFGTAATFSAVNSAREYLGGAIMPGLRISMEALERNAARLPRVQIIKPAVVCARSTVEGIQSGIFYGALGAAREISSGIIKECFGESKPLVIGTGGFAGMYSECGLYDELVPDLVLWGIYQCLMMNQP